MAEALAALGVVASVAQLAEYGFKLSIKLFAYAEAVSKADRSMRSLSNEVSMTSAVLKELGSILEKDERNYVSEKAIQATHKTVQECFTVFSQLNDFLDKALGGGSGADGKSEAAKLSTFDKLKWPFIQPRLELLQGNLDKLKASLTLMLQVLSFARDLSSQKQHDASAAMQRQVIETLARSEREATRRYEILLQRLSHGDASADAELPPPYLSGLAFPPSLSPSREPPRKPDASKPPVGELLLCINLVRQVLEVHMNDPGEEDFQRYMKFQRAVQTAHEDESAYIGEKYGGPALYDVAYQAGKDAEELHKLLPTYSSAYLSLIASGKSETQTPLVAQTYSSIIEISIPESGKKKGSKVKTTPHQSSGNHPHAFQQTSNATNAELPSSIPAKKSTPPTLYPRTHNAPEFEPSSTQGRPQSEQRFGSAIASADISLIPDLDPDDTAAFDYANTKVRPEDAVDRLLAEWTNIKAEGADYERSQNAHEPVANLSRPGTFQPSDVGFEECIEDLKYPGKYPGDDFNEESPFR